MRLVRQFYNACPVMSLRVPGDSPAALFPAPTLSVHTRADIITVCLRVQSPAHASPKGKEEER